MLFWNVLLFCVIVITDVVAFLGVVPVLLLYLTVTGTFACLLLLLLLLFLSPPAVTVVACSC